MNLLSMLLNDPIAIYSVIGLLMLFGIGGYYIYYFVKHIQQDTE